MTSPSESGCARRPNARSWIHYRSARGVPSVLHPELLALQVTLLEVLEEGHNLRTPLALRLTQGQIRPEVSRRFDELPGRVREALHFPRITIEDASQAPSTCGQKLESTRCWRGFLVHSLSDLGAAAYSMIVCPGSIWSQRSVCKIADGLSRYCSGAVAYGLEWAETGKPEVASSRRLPIPPRALTTRGLRRRRNSACSLN